LFKLEFGTKEKDLNMLTAMSGATATSLDNCLQALNTTPKIEDWLRVVMPMLSVLLLNKGFKELGSKIERHTIASGPQAECTLSRRRTKP
jgi:hypothetical protein